MMVFSMRVKDYEQAWNQPPPLRDENENTRRGPRYLERETRFITWGIPR